METLKDFRMVVDVAEDAEAAKDVDTGRVTGHDDHGLLVVNGAIETVTAEEDENLALWPDGARDVPFVTVDHIVVAIRLNGGGDIGGETSVCCVPSHV